MNERMNGVIGQEFAILLFWAGINLGRRDYFSTNHATGAGSITRPIDLQSSTFTTAAPYKAIWLMIINGSSSKVKQGSDRQIQDHTAYVSQIQLLSIYSTVLQSQKQNTMDEEKWYKWWNYGTAFLEHLLRAAVTGAVQANMVNK